MDRRSLMVSAGALAIGAALPSCTTLPQGDVHGSEDARLRAMLDRFFNERLVDNPQRATGLGLDVGELAPLRAQLNDYSAAGRARELARASSELEQLRTIDRARLSPAAELDHEVVEYDLQRALDGARFYFGSTGGRYAPYVLSQLTGPYRDVPDFLDSTHPIRDGADAEAYLSRLGQFSQALDDSLERQRQDAAIGVFAPDYVLDTTLSQLRALRGQPAAETILVASLARRAQEAGLDTDHAAQAERIVSSQVFPALDRQIAFVAELRTRAVHDAGVWRLPQGEEYYAGALKAATTTDLTADEIHQLGLEQVAELEAELDPILRDHGLTQGTAGERLARLNEDLRDTFDRPKFGLATLTYHEASPGHHLQVSLAQESDEIPLIRRLGGYSAYSEGWALYAEQLADEMGMYEGDPLGRAGMLQSFLFRATRLVVDTGLHAKRWSREQATDYFMRTTGIARGRSQGEIDRYTVWPGQATSYKVGHIVWDRLRSEAQERLGARYDIRDFHQVLLQGSVPLTVFERLVERRIGERIAS